MIDRQCSGYEGIGLITVLLGFYLFYFRKSLRFPNALTLLPIGVALVWLANSLRIVALIEVGTRLSPEIAEGGFHSAAGWLLFCVITLGLVALSRHSAWFSTDEGLRKGSLRTPEGAYLLPLLVLLATGLASALFTADFDYSLSASRDHAANSALDLPELLPRPALVRSVDSHWLGYLGVRRLGRTRTRRRLQGCNGDPRCARSDALGSCRILVDRSNRRLFDRGPRRRGARVSWLSATSPDRCRLHRRIAASVHRDLFPDLVCGVSDCCTAAGLRAFSQE